MDLMMISKMRSKYPIVLGICRCFTSKTSIYVLIVNAGQFNNCLNDKYTTIYNFYWTWAFNTSPRRYSLVYFFCIFNWSDYVLSSPSLIVEDLVTSYLLLTRWVAILLDLRVFLITHYCYDIFCGRDSYLYFGDALYLYGVFMAKFHDWSNIW